jgi:FKBP-type peptidyl-prolyl cis-trans isomerase
LRLERKAAKKKLTEQNTTTTMLTATTKPGNTNDGEKVVLHKEEYRKLKKLKRAELQKEQEKVLRKELREEKKLRKRKKLNRELNAKGGATKKLRATDTATAGQSIALVETGKAKKSSSSKKKKVDDNNHNNNNKTTRDEHDTSMDAFRSVVYGATGASTTSGGMTITRLGVQYQDKVVGKGKLLREGKPVTVKYELTGGKFGAVLDSSKKFTFRAGMGEVIRGWDIGLEGMREGGRRKLIVPPKAGYGGKDIGAGPGALLYFDVTLLSSGK